MGIIRRKAGRSWSGASQRGASIAAKAPGGLHEGSTALKIFLTASQQMWKRVRRSSTLQCLDDPILRSSDEADMMWVTEGSVLFCSVLYHTLNNMRPNGSEIHAHCLYWCENSPRVARASPSVRIEFH